MKGCACGFIVLTTWTVLLLDTDAVCVSDRSKHRRRIDTSLAKSVEHVTSVSGSDACHDEAPILALFPSRTRGCAHLLSSLLSAILHGASRSPCVSSSRRVTKDRTVPAGTYQYALTPFICEAEWRVCHCTVVDSRPCRTTVGADVHTSRSCAEHR